MYSMEPIGFAGGLLLLKRWGVAFLHAKSLIARLYGAYRAILEAELAVIVPMMFLFVKYSRTPRSRFIPKMV